ncbi:jg2784 [Pararge aegeria aegeria]|uniref:Jg2784 protein n=1 Tax=Pararge aegeria aegeria TaxID=348720 RepID=A0A8S4QR48_9NEOP|nr:jg2784 [Pararge aegeria aegeria]
MWRRTAQAELFRQWQGRLEAPSAGQRTIEAIRPVLQQWVKRKHGTLTFHLAQVLSGHGCFGRYLFKVAGREPTEVCHECGCATDTAQHTLADCPKWAESRKALVATVGQDLSLPAVVRAMVGSDRSWEAVVSFCEDVMVQKELAERLREDDVDSNPLRRRRVGRRQLAHNRRLPP